MSDAQDADFRERVRTWRNFTRLLTLSVVALVVVLVGMALTLV